MPTNDLPHTLTDIPGSTVDRLAEKLGESAHEAGLLDVAYTTVGSPIGTLVLAATDHGLVRVSFDSVPLDVVLEELAAAVGTRVLRAPSRFDEAARQLREYFSRERSGFDLPLDRQLSHGFRLDVHRYLPTIPYGATASYAEVAGGVGNPKAVRAVGTACATNPLPIVVPCHRVVRSDGSIGNYAGGPEAKRELLALEKAL